MKKRSTKLTKVLDDKVSRRSFCKNTAMASGLMMAPLTAANAAYGASSDTLKIALVGCGGRGTGAAIQALTAAENTKLVAMADAFENRLNSSLNNINEKFANSDKVEVKSKNQYVGFDGYKEAIDQADVVILTTPPGFRPQHFEYAISQGKHVFMEKPLATDAPGIRRILAQAEIAKQKNLNVVVGLQRHYQTNYREMYSRIKDGAIGDIVSGQVYWNSGGVWVRERVAGETEMQYQMKNWYYFNWLCGDHINEQHIHNIDVANWFIGETPATAQGMGGRQIRNGKDHGQIFDHHFVEFTYPSGAVISSQCRHQPGTLSRVNEVFQGTKGTSYTDGGNKGVLTAYNGEKIYKHRDEDDPNPYQVEHDELFEAINNGKVINNVEYGAKSTMSAIMGRMATYSGQLITWEQAMKSEKQLITDDLNWDTDPPVMPDKDGKYPIPMPGEFKIY